MFKCFSHWCRKFSSKKCETMSNSQPHLAIDQWLQKLDLSQYAYLLKKYNGVEDLLWLSERDFKILGIRNGGHRARLMSSLTVLKAKFGKANRGHHENANWSTGNLMVDTPNSKSIGSCSPVHHLSLEASTSGVRSWPSSGQSSKVHTRHSSHRSSMEGDIGVEASADELKKALERELSLDSSDVRSYAWYHGTILRQRAEELVAKDGDFIVRDCISQPGDYVVTTRWNGLPVHFIINKVLLQPNTVYEKTQYCFENEKFDSISGFITYYVGSKCPLSSNSGGVLSKPINRVMPLSYYASRYGIQCQIQYAARALEKIPHSPKCDLNCPPKSSPQSPKVNSKLQEIPQVNIDLDSAVCKRSSINSVSSHNTKKSVAPLTSHRQPLSRVGSDPMLSPNVEKTWEVRPHSGTISTESAKIIASEIESDRPPPKPSRVPSKKCVHRPLVIKRDRKLSPVQTGSTMNDCVEKKFESAYPKETDSEVRGKAQIPQPKRRISGETRFSFLDRRTVSEDGTNLEADMPYTIPLLNQPSLFNPSEYQSKFLEVENKPLPGAVLNKIKTTIFNESSKNLAYHLTRVDLEVMKIFKEEDLGLGVTSGLEFVLLPQGHQLQKDLLERMNCMKLFVAITILACSSEEERVKIIDKWIQIAMDTKTGFGNFCGYTGIMMGLTIPQVSCLQSTWLSLRQTHTDTAFAFETKLRPILKAMQETSGFSAPNTCIPFLLSLLSILQQHMSILELNKKESLSEENVTENILKFGLPGDQSSSDCGLQLLEDILENGRIIMQQCAIFRKNAEITLQNTKQNKLLLDVFSTEFHLRLLWGSKGANVSSKERHEKFQQVLNILSERCLK